MRLRWSWNWGLCWGLLSSLAWAAPGPPNVVMIVSDDQGWTDFSFMGHTVVRTPALDRLASQGLVFTHGYVPTSLCRPSLATMITGLYPHQHKITGNEPPRPAGKRKLAPDEQAEYRRQCAEMIKYIDQVPTLPRMLATRGYMSLQTGKWWEGHPSRAGFTESMTHGDADRGGRHGDEGLKIGREGMKRVLDFIDRAGDQPFFVWYAPIMPHTPHTPPEKLLAKYKAQTDSLEMARYWAMCEWFDETCGQLLGHLDRRGLTSNTLVVFLVDNGWIQRPDAAGSDPRSKRSPYEGGVRTPIVLRWPGKIQPGRDDRPVSSIDLMPTILAACGLPRPKVMPGIDLMDLNAVRDRKVIFGEIFEHNAVDIHRPAANLLYRWAIEYPWKLIVPEGPHGAGRTVELYNLADDPHERTDQAAAQAERVAAIRQKLDAWWSGKDY